MALDLSLNLEMKPRLRVLPLLLPPMLLPRLLAPCLLPTASHLDLLLKLSLGKDLDSGGVMALGLLGGMLTHSKELSVGLSTMIARWNGISMRTQASVMPIIWGQLALAQEPGEERLVLGKLVQGKLLAMEPESLLQSLPPLMLFPLRVMPLLPLPPTREP